MRRQSNFRDNPSEPAASQRRRGSSVSVTTPLTAAGILIRYRFTIAVNVAKTHFVKPHRQPAPANSQDSDHDHSFAPFDQ